MKYKLLMLTPAALCFMALAACASTSTQQGSAMDPACSTSKSAANDASCTAGRVLGPPVVDISKPAPVPGVASGTPQ